MGAAPLQLCILSTQNYATTFQPPSINRYTSNMSIIAQMKDRIGKRLDKMVAAAIDRTKRQVLTPLLKGPPDGSLEQC